MSILGEFTPIKRELLSAVADILPTLADELEEEINRAAEQYVYSYPATEQAMATRRGEIGEKWNFEEKYGEDYVSVTNITEPQGDDYGVPEVDFVEQGLSAYRQPYPREFMEKALIEYLTSGKADATLQSLLRSRGFDADVTVIGE